LQTGYNFSVGGTTPKIKVNSSLLGVDIQDADTTIAANLFNVRASNAAGLGSVMFGVGNTGQVTLQNSANSATAFRLLTQGGTSVLTGDTTAGQILLGQSGTLSGSLVFRNATNANTVTIAAGTPGGNHIATLPNATGIICLDNGNCAGAGGGVTTSGGTINRMPVFNGAQTLADSWLLQNSSTLQLDNTRNLSILGGNLSVTGNGTFTGTLGVTQAATFSSTVTVSTGTAPTATQVVVSNTASTGVVTNGVNGLSVNYKGGAAAVEGAAIQATINPGTTSGGIWSAFQVTPNATGAAAGVIQIGLKIDDLATPGVGSERAINIGAGWETLIQAQHLAISSAGDIATNGVIRTGWANNVNGKITLASSNAAIVASTIAVSGSQAVNIDYTLPASLPSSTQCLMSGTVSGASVPLVFGACAASTLQTAYNNSTSSELVVNGTNGALTIRQDAGAAVTTLLEVN
jgi:hypothetical protein